MSRPSRIIAYGIDPGSRTSWATYRAEVELEGLRVSRVTRNVFLIARLDDLIAEIATETASLDATSVVLSVDAPLNMPDEFDLPGSTLPRSRWPFNVNPFSVRPCEKALSSKPEVPNEKLAHPMLAHSIAMICGWQNNYNGKHSTKFTDIHDGVSVLGYQGAPHGPVVRLFRERLVQALRQMGSRLVLSPWDALSPESRHVYMVESHPAVAMAIWANQKQLPGFDRIPKYKGNRHKDTVASFRDLCATVCQLGGSYLDTSTLRVENDDDLDAFTGLLNVIDLLRGSGDWIGTVEQGYFLTPELRQLAGGKKMCEIWRTEAMKL